MGVKIHSQFQLVVPYANKNIACLAGAFCMLVLVSESRSVVLVFLNSPMLKITLLLD